MAEGSTRTTKAPGTASPNYCGNERISKIYCGATEVIKGYCGTELFFSLAPAGPTAPATAPTQVRVARLTGTGTPKLGATVIGTSASFYSYGGRHYSSYLSSLEQISIANTAATRTARTLSRSIGSNAYYGAVGDLTSGIIFFGYNGSNLSAINKLDFNTAPANVTATQLTHTGTAPAQHHPIVIGDLTSGFMFGGRSAWPPNLGDFYWYVVSGNNITTTTMTKAGAAIPILSNCAIVGDKTSGIIFGGVNASLAVVNTFYKYTISGSTITLTLLTRSGATPHGVYASSMVGNAEFGIIFGGSVNTSGDSSALSNQFRYYKVDGNTITLTALARLGTNITGRRFASMIGDPNHLGGIIYSGDIGSNTGSNDIYSFDAVIPA